MNLAIITGTTRGLGKALSEQFNAEGWSVLELSRPSFDLERAGELAPKIMARAAQLTFDRTVLINNAAGLHIQAAADQPLDTIRENLSANVIGPIQLMAAFLQAFPTGEIVDITSGVVTSDVAGWSLYAVAKAAVARHVQALSSEGHNAWCFNPGVIDTPMQQRIRSSQFPGVEAFQQLALDQKLSRPEDVARRLLAAVSMPDAERRQA